MKITASWNRKDGRPDYGNEGASVTFTLEVPDALWDPAKHHELIQSARALTALAKQSVEQDLRLAAQQYREQRERDQAEAAARHAASVATSSNGHSNGHAAPRPEPEPEPRRPAYEQRSGDWDQERGEVDYHDDRDDVQPGDRGYRDAARESDRRRDEPRRDDRRDRDQGGRRNTALDGKPPRNGKQMAGWIARQPSDVEDCIKQLMAQERMGSRYLDLSDSEVAWLYKESLRIDSRAPASNGHSNGNGYSGGRR